MFKMANLCIIFPIFTVFADSWLDSSQRIRQLIVGAEIVEIEVHWVAYDVIQFTRTQPSADCDRHNADACLFRQLRLLRGGSSIRRRLVGDDDDYVGVLGSVSPRVDEDRLSGDSQGVGEVRTRVRNEGDVVDGRFEFGAGVVGVQGEPKRCYAVVRYEGNVALVIGNVDVVDECFDEFFHLRESHRIRVRRGIDDEGNVVDPVTR